MSDFVISITLADLTPRHLRLLRAGCSEYGTSVMTHEEMELRAAGDLVAAGLMVDDGLLERNYRCRGFHTTIAGRAFLRQEGSEQS